jgi:hypothetical protein
VHCCFSLSNLCNSLQILVKRFTSKRASQGEIASDDSSSRDDEQYVISPCPRRSTTQSGKTASGGEGCSSRADEEDVWIAEGRAMVVAREARASDIIPKVER